MCDCAGHACGALSRYGVHRIVVKVGRLVGAMQGRGRRGCSLPYMSQCPHEDGGANAARARNLWSAFVLRPPWGDGARTGSVSAETCTEVCTPPAGCGQQSRDGMCYPRSMRNDWNSAKKFTQPNRRVNTQNQIVQKHTMLCLNT